MFLIYFPAGETPLSPRTATRLSCCRIWRQGAETGDNPKRAWVFGFGAPFGGQLARIASSWWGRLTNEHWILKAQLQLRKPNLARVPAETGDNPNRAWAFGFGLQCVPSKKGGCAIELFRLCARKQLFAPTVRDFEGPHHQSHENSNHCTQTARVNPSPWKERTWTLSKFGPGCDGMLEACLFGPLKLGPSLF